MAKMSPYSLLFLLLAASGFWPCSGFSAGRSIARPRPIASSYSSRISVEDNNVGDTIKSPQLQAPTQRSVARIEKFARLPVWPVWQGVFLFFASKIFGEEVAAGWYVKSTTNAHGYLLMLSL
jgi:hypothetical protein